MPEREWTRIYVDRMKITSLSSHVKTGRKRKVLDFARKFDLELMFAKLPLQNIISDRSIEELIDEIAKNSSFESVSSIIDRVLPSKPSTATKQTHKGELVMVEAVDPVDEAYSIHRPDERTIPVINKGSYLAYRRPFEKLPLFDGVYHTGGLFKFFDVESFDYLKVYLKESEDSDPASTLDSWDNFHARIIGFLGTCPPYLCRIRTQGKQEERWYSSYGLFALVVEASPQVDLNLARRMRNWRDI